MSRAFHAAVSNTESTGTGGDRGSSRGSSLRLLQDYLASDSSQQVTSTYYVERVLYLPHPIHDVIDVGCGDGNSADLFGSISPQIRWVGVDLEDSPEVRQRTRRDVEFQSFDGIRIPFDAASFDLAYSRQVFEHVRYPGELLKEIHRILRTGGFFVGSTSQLEPFHSYSYWNYTPFGFCQLLVDSGFKDIELRPGIDGFSLMGRRALGCPKLLDFLFTTESPLNLLIGAIRRSAGKDHRWANAAKLLFCGHFCFCARKT